MNNPHDNRFFNMPLCLLSKTFDEDGMLAIRSYCLADVAGRMKTNGRQALLQLAYVQSKRPGERLPEAFEALLSRDEMVDFVGMVDGLFIDTDGGDGGDGFVANAMEYLNTYPVELTNHEAAEVARWHRLALAAEVLGYRIGNHEATWLRHAELSQFVDGHSHETGALAWCSAPRDLFEEAVKSPMKRPLLRCVAAVRSLVGNHQFTGTTKPMLSARMVGAKSPKIVDMMDGDDLLAEHERLGRRRQFDNLMLDAASRGFFAKLGMGRRIWLSTTAQSPGDLKARIDDANRRRAYADAERSAREGAK